MSMSFLKRRPQATAVICGSAEYPNLKGKMSLYQKQNGVYIMTEVWGLPTCGSTVFGYHIHEGMCCQGNANDPFSRALTHYNPTDMPHPYHAGDMPPLFGNNGYAFSLFFTNRFCVRDVIGKAVIIHSEPDDFTTQPSGNSGSKIACGIIMV